MITLAIDASTYAGTVALFEGDTLVSEHEVAMRGEREERLMPAVAQCLSAFDVRSKLQRVVCGGGPGSFTSLRIAGAIAKGLAESTGASLYSVSSLGLMVAGIDGIAPGAYVAVLDAMRNESYVARVVVDLSGMVTSVSEPQLVPSNELAEFAGADVLAGRGLALEASPHARGVARMKATGLVREVSVDSWEPQYGRLAEAQVKWESAHQRSLPVAGG